MNMGLRIHFGVQRPESADLVEFTLTYKHENLKPPAINITFHRRSVFKQPFRLPLVDETEALRESYDFQFHHHYGQDCLAA